MPSRNDLAVFLLAGSAQPLELLNKRIVLSFLWPNLPYHLGTWNCTFAGKRVDRMPAKLVPPPQHAVGGRAGPRGGGRGESPAPANSRVSSARLGLSRILGYVFFSPSG